MPEAGWLLLLLFLGVCSLIVVAIMWPSFHRTRPAARAQPPTPLVADEAHQTTAATEVSSARPLAVNEWLELINDRPDEAPHTLIIGPSGTGKTTLAQAIVATRSGYLAILDPKWQPGRWGGLRAVPIDDDGRYTLLEETIKALLAELTSRLVSLKQGVTAFPELTIVAEEFPTLIGECPSAPSLFKQVGRLGRELRIRLVGLSQSERVKSLGIAGEGDARDNFTLIRLGKVAVDTLPRLRSTPRPAVLEWKGEHFELTLDGVPYFSSFRVPAARSWASYSAIALQSKQALKQPLEQELKQHESTQSDKNNAEILFSVDEVGVIVSLIISGTDKKTAIPLMPRYTRKQHRAYVTYYDRLTSAIQARQDQKAHPAQPPQHWKEGNP